MRLHLPSLPERDTQGLLLPTLVAVTLALICSQVTPPAAGGADTEVETRDLAAIAETIEQAIAALPEGGRAFGQALAGEALAALRDANANALSRHQTKLLLNTITFVAQYIKSQTPEETECHKAWMYMATERLARVPVTEEETAELCSQCAQLPDRLGPVVQELMRGEGLQFGLERLASNTEGLLRCARSLLCGGPMRPMSAQQLDELVAVFRQAIEKGEGPKRPGAQLALAMAAVSERLRQYSTGFGPADNTPRVNAAIEAKRQALQRRRDAGSAEFEAQHYGSIMRSTMGGMSVSPWPRQRQWTHWRCGTSCYGPRRVVPEK